eukprot:scaffold72785_cov15-Tisochrysis_lutea.AAC.2
MGLAKANRREQGQAAQKWRYLLAICDFSVKLTACTNLLEAPSPALTLTYPHSAAEAASMTSAFESSQHAPLCWRHPSLASTLTYPHSAAAAASGTSACLDPGSPSAPCRLPLQAFSQARYALPVNYCVNVSAHTRLHVVTQVARQLILVGHPSKHFHNCNMLWQSSFVCMYVH